VQHLSGAHDIWCVRRLKRNHLSPLLCALISGAIPLSADSVLLILADDLGRDSLAQYNRHPRASIPPTPTLDALAESGIRFDRMYAYSSCSPTRASILTGRHAFRTGVISPEINELQPNEFTLAEAIVESGVIGERLAHLGKWHLGNEPYSPNEIGGWPHFAGALGGGLPSYSRWNKVINGITTEGHTVYASSDLVNDAIDWIADQGTEDWFLWLAFNAPHSPLHKPDNQLHDYDDLEDSVAAIEANPRPYYEAMVQSMDTEIARLLEAIDLESTTVIFVGDNGTPGQIVQLPFTRGHAKGSLYEGGINVPLIVAGSAIPQTLRNTASDSILHSVDLYRTILDLLNIDSAPLLPSELIFDSISFYPLLSGQSTTHSRSYAFSENPASIEDGRTVMFTNQYYKWIQFEDGTEEFYRIADGLDESINRMEGTLESIELHALTNFESHFLNKQNRPKVHWVGFNEKNHFTIEIGWFANADLRLQTKQSLKDASWDETSNFTQIDEGSAILTLISESPQSATGQFYRIVRE